MLQLQSLYKLDAALLWQSLPCVLLDSKYSLIQLQVINCFMLKEALENKREEDQKKQTF